MIDLPRKQLSTPSQALDKNCSGSIKLTTILNVLFRPSQKPWKSTCRKQFMQIEGKESRITNSLRYKKRRSSIHKGNPFRTLSDR